jgi:DNA-binding GntR family transcriptional regulator
MRSVEQGAFHDAVFAATGHQRLAFGCIPQEHHALAAALRARDPEAALRLFAAHRRHAVDVVTGTSNPA